jgi:hypothetical protein
MAAAVGSFITLKIFSPVHCREEQLMRENSLNFTVCLFIL